MEGLWIIIVAMAMAVVFALENARRRLRSKSSKTMVWPIGPRSLPIIGNLHQLYKGGNLLHVTLASLAQEYGRIMTIWIGSQHPTIVVSDHELAWEVLVSKAQEYAARTLPYMSKFVTADWQTLATSDAGPYWHALRKGLQNSALNPSNITAQVQFQEKDIESMTQSLWEEACNNNGVVEPLMQLRRTTVKLVGRLCFGPEFEDEVFVQGMDSAVEDTIRLTGFARLVDVFEFTQYIPGLKLPFEQTYQVKRKIEDLVLPYIARQRKSESPSTNCYLYFLLSQDLPEQVVIFSVFELFLLGVDSTSMATAWALGFLIHDKETQHKLYEEISQGGRDTITVEAVSKLQYLHAVVKESMRLKPIAPLAVPHKAVKDSTLMGLRVLEGTSVLVNLYAVLRDGSVWRDPNRFMPERFLANSKHGHGNGGVGNGLERAMERSFLPFGAGRRVCAGMELAKVHVALTLANLVNRFEWGSAVEGELPDMSEDLTFVLRMKTPLKARIVPRRL